MEETLGKRIVANRKRLGITQDRLAEQLGVTAQAVSKWENDLSCPDIAILPKLAEIFGISVDALLGMPPQTQPLEAEVVTANVEAGETEGIHIQNRNWEFRLDTGRMSLLSSAVLFIWVGIVYMLRSMGGQPTNLWSLLWPSALLIYGGFALFQKFTFLRLGCTFLGACFLFSNMNDFNLGGVFVLPGLLILLGASLLVRAFRKPKKSYFHVTHNGNPISREHVACDLGADAFRCDCSFSSRHQVIELPRLRSGSAEVSFGELTVDLTGCGEFSENCSINADCSFGSLTLLVPKSIRAEVASDTAFGCVDIRGNHDSEVASAISIHADVSFGQIAIAYI